MDFGESIAREEFSVLEANLLLERVIWRAQQSRQGLMHIWAVGRWEGAASTACYSPYPPAHHCQVLLLSLGGEVSHTPALRVPGETCLCPCPQTCQSLSLLHPWETLTHILRSTNCFSVRACCCVPLSSR